MLYFDSSEVEALLQVIMIDLVLTGDNAIVIGLVAAWAAAAATDESCAGGYHRCDGPADSIRRSHHPAVAGGGWCLQGAFSCFG